MRRRSILAGAGAVAVLLSGCASASEPDVVRVATQFSDPSGDPQARCELLAPATLEKFESDASTPCTEAIGSVPLSGGVVHRVEIWGGDAQVRIAGDTLFLTETDAGWRVTAAGCQPRGQAPYDCEVEGP
jgi:hypothetical protein